MLHAPYKKEIVRCRGCIVQSLALRRQNDLRTSVVAVGKGWCKKIRSQRTGGEQNQKNIMNRTSIVRKRPSHPIPPRQTVPTHAVSLWRAGQPARRNALERREILQQMRRQASQHMWFADQCRAQAFYA